MQRLLTNDEARRASDVGNRPVACILCPMLHITYMSSFYPTTSCLIANFLFSLGELACLVGSDILASPVFPRGHCLLPARN